VFEYARRQVLDPGEAVTQFESSDRLYPTNQKLENRL